MSHYLGIVFFEGEPTQEALDDVMSAYKEREWDWYRPGGRWDGWLSGEEEMKSRETDNGFNFQPENKRIDRNVCKGRDLPVNETPYFFLAKYGWIKKEIYIDGYPHGRFLDNSEYEAQYDAARHDFADQWALVVDVHN